MVEDCCPPFSYLLWTPHGAISVTRKLWRTLIKRVVGEAAGGERPYHTVYLTSLLKIHLIEIISVKSLAVCISNEPAIHKLSLASRDENTHGCPVPRGAARGGRTGGLGRLQEPLSTRRVGKQAVAFCRLHRPAGQQQVRSNRDNLVVCRIWSCSSIFASIHDERKNAEFFFWS